MKLTRRQLIGGAGVAVAGAATAAAASHGLAVNLDGRRNVVLIMIDTLRADHVGSYGASLMHTPNIDALAASGTQFDRVFPEAMPTVPARRSLLTGRRTFPFRDWEPWAGLGSTPGWEPIAPGTPTLVSELSRHGYATACVTDNPFLGFARAFRPLRRSFDRFVSIAGQVPRGPLPEEVSVAEARRLIPRNRWDELRHIEDMRRYLAANGGLGADIDESQTATGRVFATAQWLARRMLDQRPFLLMVDGFDPHELAMVLETNYGILTRPGIHCAPLAHQTLGTLAGGGTTRFSFSPFLTKQDVKFATDALAEIAMNRVTVA